MRGFYKGTRVEKLSWSETIWVVGDVLDASLLDSGTPGSSWTMDSSPPLLDGTSDVREGSVPDSCVPYPRSIGLLSRFVGTPCDTLERPESQNSPV